MRAIFSSLIAAALAAHALLGCCWHHAHRCLRCETAVPAGAQPAKCCRHHDEQQHALATSPEPSSPDEPCTCHLECTGTCAYLPTPKTRADDRESVSPVSCLPPIAAATANLRAAGPIGQALGSSGPPQPPLRLHLWHQVLLI